jgi:transposase-like protein
MTEDRRSGEDRRTHTRGGRRSTDKVLCPHCEGVDHKVTHTRGITRYRACACGRRFTTYETTTNPHAA